MLSNRKAAHRRGRVQLIDATQWSRPLRKNLGSKNCELSDEDIQRICDAFLAFEETEQSKIFPNEAFGYWKVTVERPLRLTVDLSSDHRQRFRAACRDAKDEPLANVIDQVATALGAGPHPDFNRFMEVVAADASAHGVKLTAKRKNLLQLALASRDEAAAPVIKKTHKPGAVEPDPIRGLIEAAGDGQSAVVEYEPDTDLRDTEQVPLLHEGGIEAFIRREVLPYAPDAWYDVASVKVGYEISLHPPLLQTAAVAPPGGDTDRHSGTGTGNRGTAGGNCGERASMSVIPSFQEGSIESLAKLLAECGSGSDISRVLADRGIQDGSGQSTKWRRLYWIFLDVQRRDRCANRILDFIQSLLTPARFVGRNDEFEGHRSELNTVLALAGFEYGADGKFRNRPAAATLSEAERRVKTIQAKFQGRRIHPEVLKYCQAELMQHNYFHAVFEASKGLAQQIRDKSGVDGDGAKLVDSVFSVNGPVLAFKHIAD